MESNLLTGKSLQKNVCFFASKLKDFKRQSSKFRQWIYFMDNDENIAFFKLYQLRLKQYFIFHTEMQQNIFF